MKERYWCMSCGVYIDTQCEEIGHISRLTKPGVISHKEPTTVAVNYLGRVSHLKVKLP
jgi:hypothetical protein